VPRQSLASAGPLPTIHFLFCCLQTLCPSCKTQPLYFQADADSFAKTAGVGSQLLFNIPTFERANVQRSVRCIDHHNAKI
jgi:hypothetical protein